MWKCNWCEEYFEKPKWVKRGPTLYAICPYCGEEDIVDVTDNFDECECCGKQKMDVRDGLCDECAQELYDLMEETVEGAMEITHKDYMDTKDIIRRFLKNVWHV